MWKPSEGKEFQGRAGLLLRGREKMRMTLGPAIRSSMVTWREQAGIEVGINH